jgi:magnesium transporter
VTLETGTNTAGGKKLCRKEDGEMKYLIQNQLTECPTADCPAGCGVVEVLTGEEAAQQEWTHLMDIPLQAMEHVRFCKAEVHQGWLLGTFCVPRKGIREQEARFFYAVSHNEVTFVDDSGMVKACLRRMAKNKVWNTPGLGRFLCDFMESMLNDDLLYLSKVEDRLARMEDAVLSGTLDHFNQKMIACRKEILRMSHYYLQLSDIGVVMQEDENGFFGDAEQRAFRLFTERVNRLREETERLREYSTQVREVYQTQIDIRQNRIMKVLTVVTTVFLPLSLIVGWYGMNFAYMPELHWRYGYPAVLLLSCAVVGFCVWLFKKKRFW